VRTFCSVSCASALAFGFGVGAVGVVARQAPTAVAADASVGARAPEDRVIGRELVSRRRVLEIVARGTWVAAVVGRASFNDCSQDVLAWDARTGRLVRFDLGAAYSCEFLAARYPELALPRVTWNVISCGNECYSSRDSADLRRPERITSGAESVMEDTFTGVLSRTRPAPTTVRGVSMSYARGKVTLRRLADDRTRTFPSRGTAAHAALASGGLFYGYNHGAAPYQGRIVFVPFAELFS
jgi:hypothetical protein